MPVPRKTIADRHDFKHRLIALNGRLGVPYPVRSKGERRLGADNQEK